MTKESNSNPSYENHEGAYGAQYDDMADRGFESSTNRDRQGSLMGEFAIGFMAIFHPEQIPGIVRRGARAVHRISRDLGR